MPERPTTGSRPLPGEQGDPVARAGAGAIGVIIVVGLTLAFLLVRPNLVSGTPRPADGPPASTVVATGRTTQAQVSIDGMSFVPSTIEVPAGNDLRVTLLNTADQRHDLAFANGTSTTVLAPGAQETIDVGVVTSNLEGWCTLPGHRQMGMILHVVVTGADQATGPSLGSLPPSEPAPTAAELMQMAKTAEPLPATLPPLSRSRDHHVTFRVTEQTDELAPGRTRTVWTYNGTSPGPVLHGRVGDTFHITLMNDGTMGHSIDFHAGELAPDRPMRTIDPGQSLRYTFTARRSGIWMYHCSTTPMSNHIANGMFGAVVIDPPGLPAVDHSYVLVASEQYPGPDGQPADAAKVAAMTPDVTAFNGRAFQYDAHPLTAAAGQRIRIWVLDAGPNLPMAFHVVGTQFDTVWSEGAYRVRHGRDTGAQVLSLSPAEGGFVEFVPRQAGHYAIVNHEMSLSEKGAHGILAVS